MMLLVIVFSACNKPKDNTDKVAPVTSASIESGLHSAQTVKLSCDDGEGDGCLQTYYTIDGTTPNRASAPYAGPIAIWNSTTLKYFSIDKAGNTEKINTQTYTIGSIVLTDVQSFSAGRDHTAAIQEDGSLWSWGGNDFGQLGNSTTNKTPAPIQIGEGESWKMAKAGNGFTLAIKNDGSLWAWGLNNKGQLGTDSTLDSQIPTQVGSENSWEKVALGGAHALAIKSDGTLWAWGANDHGQLGNDTTTDALTPIQIGSGSSWDSVSAGQEHSIALRNDGTIWTWGANTYGQLGNGTNSDSKVPVINTEINWSSISAGDHHVLAIKNDGTLWAWGQNWFGQLGDGTTITKAWGGAGSQRITGYITFDKLYPFQIGTYRNWQSVSAGRGHSIGIQEDGRLWAWGLNVNGQLGDGTTMNNLLPLPVGAELAYPNVLPKHPWVNLSAGSDVSFGLKNDGTLWSWGWNGSGQLGNRSTQSTAGGSAPDKATWRIPKFSYALSDKVYAYSVDYQTGLLTSIDEPKSAGSNPTLAATHRTNKFLYVVDSSIDRKSPSYITTFSINKDTGALTQVGQPVETLIGASSIHMDPLGRFVYIVGYHMRKWNFRHISVYSVDPVTGELTCTGTSINGIQAMAFDPLGRFAYVVKGGTLLTYDINQTNGLLPDIFDNDLDKDDLGEPTSATDLAVDRSGQFIYMTTPGEIVVRSINQTNGDLIDTDFSEPSPGISDYVFSESNLYIYMLYATNLNVFTVNQITGQVTDATFEAAPNAIGAITDPTGKFVYIFTPDFVNGYSIDPHHGSTKVIGSSNVPTDMALDATSSGGTIKALLFASF